MGLTITSCSQNCQARLHPADRLDMPGHPWYWDGAIDILNYMMGGKHVMKMILILLGGIILLFGVTGGVSQGKVFILSDVHKKALMNHEDVKIARKGLNQAREGKWRAISSFLPRLFLDGTYTRFPEETVSLGGSTVLLQPEASYGMELRFEQTLFAGGKNRAGIHIAQEEVRVARKNLNLSTENVLLQATQLYYGILRARKDLEAQQRNVERLLEHRRLSELRFKVGEVTETIVLRAEAELAEARAELVVRENVLSVQRHELRILAGLPDGFEVEDPSLPQVPEIMESEALEAAFQNRDDLRRSESEEKIAKEEISISRADFWFPSIVFQGTYFNRDQEPRSTFFIDESWFVGGHQSI